jgi:hypothetical protein
VEHKASDRPHDVPELRVVRGTSTVQGRGPVRRFMVEVQRGLDTDRAAFGRYVERVLFDRRSWTGPGARTALQRVDSGRVNFRVTLASSRMTDRLCYPLQTNGRVSCENRGRAVINFSRWSKGASAWNGNLRGYRRYLLNHEVGHSLGHKHPSCPGARRRAPVMLQQTGGAAPCRRSSWPLRREREATPVPYRRYGENKEASRRARREQRARGSGVAAQAVNVGVAQRGM